MRVLVLHLRSRRAGHAAAALLAVAAIGWRWANSLLALPQFGGVSGSALVPVLMLMPILAGCVIALSTPSPFGEAERIASLPLSRLRLAHLAGLLLAAALLLSLVATRWERADATLTLLRNLAAFTGLALAGAWLIGGRLAWVVPIAYGGLVVLTGRLEHGGFAWWAFVLHPGRDRPAALLAIATLALGLVLVVARGARDQEGEEPV